MKLEDYIKNRISIINIYSKKNNIKLQNVCKDLEKYT